MGNIRASRRGREKGGRGNRERTRLLGLALAGSLSACGGSKEQGFAEPSISAGGSTGGSSGETARPVFGPTTVASVPPPPISGGTLLTMRDGIHAVAADPERDSVYVVNLNTHAVDFVVALTAGDEPGRLIEDGAGRIHVALRSSGALTTIDPSKGTVIDRRNVCPAPRGLAWDSTADLVWVACATGELVALPAAGGAATRTFTIERDLRDVIIDHGSLTVTQFRSAEALRIASDGTIARRDAFPSPEDSFSPHVAWRTVAGPSGTVVATHQAESTASIATHAQGGYGGGIGGGGTCFAGTTGISNGAFGGAPEMEFDAGAPLESFTEAGPVATPGDPDAQGSVAVDAQVQDGADEPAATAVAEGGSPGCLDVAGGDGGSSSVLFFSGSPPSASPPGCLPSSVVMSVLTAVGSDGSVTINTTFPGVLPVDVAVSPSGASVAAVAPGNAFTAGLDTVFVFNACGTQREATSLPASTATSEQPIAVAYNGEAQLLVQTREPAQLIVFGPRTPIVIALSSASREDTGHDVFHTQAGALIACASCHPEGRDDGHVWVLDGDRRRTPSLLGTIAGTAPYHWPGDEANLNVLVNDVYTVRMDGTLLPDDELAALTGWVQTVPPPPAPAAAKSSASERGQVIFERTDVGCATCHSGPKFTNNKTVDVGTGGAFQVPPLVGVGWRTPLMHDGCAATIADRFGACSTVGHGSTASLSAGDISDLIAYLGTL